MSPQLWSRVNAVHVCQQASFSKSVSCKTQLGQQSPLSAFSSRLVSNPSGPAAGESAASVEAAGPLTWALLHMSRRRSARLKRLGSSSLSHPDGAAGHS